LTLKGSAIFTAEPQRTLREIFFSFPLRGRKAKILSPNSKGKIYSLCELCDLSEAGGERYSLTYTHSKARTISIAEDLKVLINGKGTL